MLWTGLKRGAIQIPVQMTMAEKIIPERIREARESTGLTDDQFAEAIDVTRGAVGHYETGQTSPRGEVLARIISVTGLPPSFFTKVRGRSVTRFRMPNWRSLKRMQRPARLRIGRRLEWTYDIVSLLEEFIDLPSISVPQIDFDFETGDDDEIELVADSLRQFWELGDEPIQDLPAVLECNGFILINEEVGCDDMDAVSRWQGGRPYILYANDVESYPRQLFNLAHELGHIVLHSSVEVNSKNLDKIERQANRFAGAFLLPRKRFASEVASTSIEYFLMMKTRWRVAVAAMVYRCKDLGILNPAQVQYMWKQMNVRGIRKKEPGDRDFPLSQPTVLATGLRMLAENGIKSKAGIVGDLTLNPADIERLSGLESEELQTKVIPLRLLN
ncbi:helix-turn-helix protein [bacterium BMS3Bbin10]|nr:helix-turn-helix protein [bacterium BMS3Bbin10]